MISKTLSSITGKPCFCPGHKAPRGNPCSCQDGIPCAGCKKKTVIKPTVYLEEPRQLPVPIVITHYRRKPPTVVNRATAGRRPFWCKKGAPPWQKLTVCRWFRKKKALKELKEDNEKERQRLKWDPIARAQKEQEYEYFQQLYKQRDEEYQRKKIEAASLLNLKPIREIKDKPKKDKIMKPKKEKRIKPKKEKHVKEKVYRPKKEKVYKPKKEKVHKPKKEKVYKPKKESIHNLKDSLSTIRKEKRYTVKSASVRPRAISKGASVRTYNQHQSLTERFVNGFYRFCCQLYCCFTVLILIGVAVIVLI